MQIPYFTAPVGRCALWLAFVAGLAACGSQDSFDAAALRGQVASAGSGSTSKVSQYAAARLLEQAAMGPSPSAVASVRQSGMEAWIDAQMALPPTLITTPETFIEYDLQDRPISDRAWEYHRAALMNAFVGGADQLRIRTTWALSNFLVVSTRKIQPYGGSEYFNTLQRGAFGSYGDLLKAVTRSPAMGFYLDNGQNNKFSLNENYGRELMQLFSVGLVQLNLDGTPKRDASGKPIETYSQFDVIEATRALTGWQYVERTRRFNNDANGFNYGKPMEARWTDGHDTGEKKVLGRTIPAGQTAEQDLNSLVQILVEHPNTAPFVSLRLIQNMAASDPSPKYVERVATVFRQSQGNLGKVVKAILTDPEARLGDVPGRSPPGFGRIKDPVLLLTSVQRGLSCRFAVTWWNEWQAREEVWTPHNQMPLNAFSVFNFYAPNHRAPGSQLLAPEQKTLTSSEFSWRMGAYQDMLRPDRETYWKKAGCDLSEMEAAARKSDDDLIEFISQRFFKGSMPAALRQALKASVSQSWLRETPLRTAGAMLDMAVLTPAMGVSR